MAIEPKPETPFFGLTRIGRGEKFDKNGYAFSDLDVLTLDALLNALAHHAHTGEDRLADPEVVPVLTPLATGGTLPSDVTLYYRISYVDRWGLETAASDEVPVITTPGIASPAGPAVEAESTNGILAAGNYSYAITFVTDDGGETLPSTSSDVKIPAGGTSRARLMLPTIPDGVMSIRIYRSRPGQTRFYLLSEVSTEIAYDDGTISEDTTITPPSTNTTNSSNSVRIELPSIPEGVFSWKIYRATEPGVYSGFNLVHHVVESTTETSNDLRTFWVDTGDVMEQGEPRMTTSTLGGGEGVSSGAGGAARGSRVWSTVLPGELTAREYNRTTIPEDIVPTAMTVFFPTPPEPGPSEQIRIQIADSQATPNVVELIWGEAQAGEPYLKQTWPLADERSQEAEAGERSTDSPIVSDLTASNGQSVEMPGESDFIDIFWGELEQGVYRPFVTLRIDDDQPATPATVTFEIIRLDTDQVIGSSEIVIEEPGPWEEFEGQQFSAPGGVALKFRVYKSDAIPLPYYVDSMRYQAIVPTLAAGDLSVNVEYVNAGSTPFPGADAQLALWF